MTAADAVTRAEFLSVSRGRRVYVARTAPGSAVRVSQGVRLICAPFLEEHHWSYRTLYDLARAATVDDQVTWRFDPSGTGNSTGELESLDVFLADAWEVIDHILAVESIDHLDLVGVRLGGFVALSMAARHPAVRHVALIAPVMDPWRHVRQLLHATTLAPRSTSRPDEFRDQGVDYLGQRLPEAFLQSLRSQAPALAPRPERRLLVVEIGTPGKAVSRALDRWVGRQVGHVQRARLDLPPFWGRLGIMLSAELTRELRAWTHTTTSVKTSSASEMD